MIQIINNIIKGILIVGIFSTSINFASASSSLNNNLINDIKKKISEVKSQTMDEVKFIKKDKENVDAAQKSSEKINQSIYKNKDFLTLLYSIPQDNKELAEIVEKMQEGVNNKYAKLIELFNNMTTESNEVLIREINLRSDFAEKSLQYIKIIESQANQICTALKNTQIQLYNLKNNKTRVGKSSKSEEKTFTEQIKQCGEKIESLSSELSNKDNVINELEGKIKLFNSELSNKHNVINELEEKIKLFNSKLSDKDNEIKEYKEQIESLNSQLSSKDKIIKSQEIHIEYLQKNFVPLKETINSLQGQNYNLYIQISILQRQLFDNVETIKKLQNSLCDGEVGSEDQQTL